MKIRITTNNTGSLVFPDIHDISQHHIYHVSDWFSMGDFGGWMGFWFWVREMSVSDGDGPLWKDWVESDLFKRFYELQDVEDPCLESPTKTTTHTGLYLSADILPEDAAFLRSVGAYPLDRNFKDFNEKWKEVKKAHRAMEKKPPLPTKSKK